MFDIIPKNKFTLDEFMREKTLKNEHQKLFTKIDNLLEEQVSRGEDMVVFTKPQVKIINPLYDDD